MSETECPSCGRNDFKSELGMMQHHANIHGDRLSQVQIECPSCGDTFEVQRTNKENRKYCSQECMAQGFSDVDVDGNGKPRVQIECEWCGTIVERRPSDSNGRFCSKNCFYKWRSESGAIDGEKNPCWRGGKITKSCLRCGDDVTRPESQMGKRTFCSKDCAYNWLRGQFTGDDHPRWAGGGTPYYGENWHTKRRKALNRDNRRCQSCGAKRSDLDRDLHVHHIRPIRKFDTPENANKLKNLVSLCESCHLGKWEGIPLRPQLVDN